MKTNEKIQKLITDWMTNPRWKGVRRPYTAEKVIELQGLKTFENKKLNKFEEDFLAKSDVVKIIVNNGESSEKEVVSKLIDARLIADVNCSSTLIVVKVSMNNRLSIDDEISKDFFSISSNLQQEIERSLGYAPYADLICLETSKLNLGKAKVFAKAFFAKYPYKNLAYSCLEKMEGFLDNQQAKKELEKIGYKILLNSTKADIGVQKNGVISLNSSNFNEDVYFDAV
jgi:isocitrate lyase